MKNKLCTLAAALTLAAVLGGVYAAPALAAVIKAALVKSVDEPGRNPYQQTVATSGLLGASRLACPTVPADKRLVLQHIHFTVTSLNQVDEVTLSVGNNFFNLINNNSSGRWITHLPIVAFVNPGDACEVVLQAPENSKFRLTFTGYLVDVTI